MSDSKKLPTIEIGDTVVFRTDLEVGKRYNGITFHEDMTVFLGTSCVVREYDNVGWLKIEGSIRWFANEMFDNVMHWDDDLENIGLPSNMQFSFGSEFGDINYRLQMFKHENVRWCVFSVDRNYYAIKQELVEGNWVEVWTKQMDKSLTDAKQYCESDALNHSSEVIKPSKARVYSESEMKRAYEQGLEDGYHFEGSRSDWEAEGLSSHLSDEYVKSLNTEGK